MSTYFELNTYSNQKKSGASMSRAYKKEKNAYAKMLAEYTQALEDKKRFGQILSVEAEYECEEEGKRGRKREPKMIGFEMKCKGGYEYYITIEEAEGDIEHLEEIERFSD